MRRVILMASLVVVIALINIIVWQSVVTTPLKISGPVPAGSTLIEWKEFMTVVARGDKSWDIPPALAAYEGKLITIDGVLFTMPQLLTGNNMEAAILTPPSRYGCCGLQCTTHPQLMMLTMWEKPLAKPTEKTVPARVTGILRFNRDGTAWTMSELENAQAVFP